MATLNEVLKRVEELPEPQHDTDKPDTAAAERKLNPLPVLRSVGVGKRHVACSFAGYQGREKTVSACKGFVAEPSDLVLTGGPGTGKTHLAVAVLRELVRENQIKGSDDARFVPVPELLAEIRASYRGDGPDERDIIGRYSRLPFLVLDDLGAEKTTEWSITTLYLIIDRRYREALPTIVTTNLSMEQIAAVLSERISSRLASGKVIQIKGEDFRMKRG